MAAKPFRGNHNKRLKMCLIDHGIKSLHELAIKAGIHSYSVYNFSRASCNPTIRTARRMANAIGITLDELVDILMDETASKRTD